MSREGRGSRAYRLLLRLLPRDLREQWGSEMEATFADRMARAKGSLPDRLSIWVRGALDVVAAADAGSRAAGRLGRLDVLRQDALFATRQIVRAPGVTGAVVLSLALGIGGTTAIFGLVDAVLLRTLPVEEPGRLFFMAHGERASTSSNYPLLERYRRLDVFEGVTAYERRELNVATPDGLERVSGQFVSGNYHELLGVGMSLGYGLSSEVDRAVGSNGMAVISDGYWARAFGRDPGVLGRLITVNGHALRIAGVTAPGFHGLMSGYEVDLTLPMSIRGADDPGFFDDRESWRSMTIVVRLRDDVGDGQALAAADATFRRFWAEPENAWARGDNDEPRSAVLLPAGRGSDSLRRQFGLPLILLMGMVGLVLVIACANVANLLLVRATTRVREVAVRMSIGASRSRLVRQFLTEATLLSCVGGALGLLVAPVASRFIARVLATGRTPVFLAVDLNAKILLLALAVSLLTGIAIGLVPALRATRLDLTPSLKEGGTTTGPSRRMSVMKALVVGQFALCTVLVSMAALMTRTLMNLKQVDAGFASEGTLLVNVEAPPELESARRLGFYTHVQERLEALSGVEALAYSARSPLDNSENRRPFEVLEASSVARLDGGVSEYIVSPAYFELFEMRLERGRFLSLTDRAGAERAAVINQTLARRAFGGAEPLGRTVLLGADRHPFTIVGIVGDARESALREEPLPAIYTAVAQSPVDSDGGGGTPRRMTIALRSAGDAFALAPFMRREISQVSPQAVVTWIRTMDQQVDASIVRERMLTRVSAVFSLLALILAAVGLYGTLSYFVARYTREIGLRLALGATQHGTRRLVMAETLTLAATGVALGLAVTLGAARLLASFLFGLSASDPVTLSAVVAMLLLVAFVSSYGPARRAGKVDLMVLLRAPW